MWHAMVLTIDTVTCYADYSINRVWYSVRYVYHSYLKYH